MKPFYKGICLCILAIGTLLAGCNITSAKNKLPSTKPKDFNFVFSYGVDSKNLLNTVGRQYTKDMVLEPSVSTDLKLSDDDMDIIYSEMRTIDILDYPDNFSPKSNVVKTPYYTYNFKITVDGLEKNIFWEDKNVSNSKEAVLLRSLFKKIQEIIESKEEYKKLPEARGAYA